MTYTFPSPLEGNYSCGEEESATSTRQPLLVDGTVAVEW